MKKVSYLALCCDIAMNFSVSLRQDLHAFFVIFFFGMGNVAVPSRDMVRIMVDLQQLAF